MLLSAQEWCEATDNLLAAIGTLAPPTANLFSMHFRAVKDRLTPSWWPMLRTYDLRIRLAHTGSAGDFATTLLEAPAATINNFPRCLTPEKL